MPLVLFWIATILGSYAITLRLVFMMLKDLADSGYKLNADNVKKVNEELNLNVVNSKLLFLVPILNLLYSFKIVIDYNNIKWTILDQFRILGVLENMSLEEQKKYNENPTLINALMLSVLDEESYTESQDLGECYDELIKTIEENRDLNEEEVIEKVKNTIELQKSERLNQIIQEKETLKNYKKEIEEKTNKKKVLVKKEFKKGK